VEAMNYLMMKISRQCDRCVWIPRAG